MMRMLLPLLLQAGVPPVPDPAADIRCGAVFSQQMHEDGGIVTAGLLVGIAFLIGRIEGARPGVDAAAAIEAARTAPGASIMIEADRRRCAVALDAVFDRLEKISVKDP